MTEPRKSRDLMAPDTDPTDEELALVMREAGELVRQRKAIADAKIAEMLAEAARYAREYSAVNFTGRKK